jgi:hypothetical protein
MEAGAYPPIAEGAKRQFYSAECERQAARGYNRGIEIVRMGTQARAEDMNKFDFGRVNAFGYPEGVWYFPKWSSEPPACYFWTTTGRELHWDWVLYPTGLDLMKKRRPKQPARIQVL